MIKTFNHSRRKHLNRKYLRILAQKVWDNYKKNRCIVSINFVDNDSMTALHKKYLQKNSDTDVITFNLGPGPQGKEIGDIYICPDVAELNAQKFSCPVDEELARLVVHGMLHFVGFDDASPEDRQEMHLLENKFLAQDTEQI
ncbi:MAG: rRNA maturation RNase YbeY [Calditrichaeota bacterium]|nr:MAG: rRNA maturation RNase YbeY [Calditrichota bacterium]